MSWWHSTCLKLTTDAPLKKHNSAVATSAIIGAVGERHSSCRSPSVWHFKKWSEHCVKYACLIHCYFMYQNKVKFMYSVHHIISQETCSSLICKKGKKALFIFATHLNAKKRWNTSGAMQQSFEELCAIYFPDWRGRSGFLCAD